MNCEDYQTVYLTTGGDRKQLKAALDHIEGCTECSQAVDDYDSIQNLLKPAADIPEPSMGWDRFSKSLTPKREIQWQPFVWPAIAAILVICLAISLTHTRVQPASRELQEVKNGNGLDLAYTKDEVTQNMTVFQEMSNVYGNQTGWVMVSDSTADVGLVPAEMISSQQVLLLRLNMLNNKQVVSSSDLVIVAGQSAHLSVPFENGQELKYTVSTSDGENPALSVWVEVRNGQTKPRMLAALATQITPQKGQVVSAGELVTSAGKYELKISFSQSKI